MLLNKLKSQTRLSSEKLERFAATASLRYKSYTIPKRTGGHRLIEHPSKEIKSIQKWLNLSFISLLPIHESATAYRKGSSIRHNAAKHSRMRFTLRFDFKDFFPSFSEDHVEFFLNARAKLNFPINEEDVNFIKRIVCRNGRLTIGAPSSPHLTNAMMYEFDFRMGIFCEQKSLIYTRYADDIFVSADEPDLLNVALSTAQSYASQHPFAKLELNDDKTAFLSKKFRRQITGLVITSDHKISIGLERKKYIKSQIYKYKIGQLDADKIQQLNGHISFAQDAEPSFFGTLIRKYGAETIAEIRAGVSAQARTNIQQAPFPF